MQELRCSLAAAFAWRKPISPEFTSTKHSRTDQIDPGLYQAAGEPHQVCRRSVHVLGTPTSDVPRSCNQSARHRSTPQVTKQERRKRFTSQCSSPACFGQAKVRDTTRSFQVPQSSNIRSSFEPDTTSPSDCSSIGGNGCVSSFTITLQHTKVLIRFTLHLHWAGCYMTAKEGPPLYPHPVIFHAFDLASIFCYLVL
jgi:hypothetical protein